MKKIMLAILNGMLGVYWLVEAIFVAIGVNELTTYSQILVCLIACTAFITLAVLWAVDFVSEKE